MNTKFNLLRELNGGQMRNTELVLVTLALILFLAVGPLRSKYFSPPKHNEHRQEEVAREDDMFESGETIQVSFRPQKSEENQLVDILWLKKAALVAIDAGIPHFNVRKKEISKFFHRKLQRRMNHIEGVIELESDQMRAQYDANEILSLTLPEESQ